MDFLEISNGITIDINKIEAIIEDSKKPVCKVYISGVSYPSKYNKQDLLSVLSRKNARKGSTVQEKIYNVLKHVNTP